MGASKRCRVGRKRKFEEDQQEAFDLGVRNLELKSQVESLESQVKEFKALVFQMIKNQKAPAPAKVPTSFIGSPIPMASTSKHDPTDLSFLDDPNLQTHRLMNLLKGPIGPIA